MNHYDLVVCEPSPSWNKMQKINGAGHVKLENVDHVLIKCMSWELKEQHGVED